MYTIVNWRGAPWGAESSQRRSHTIFNDFCRNIFLTEQEKKKEKKDYTYLDDGEPGERNGSEAAVETIAARQNKTKWKLIATTNCFINTNLKNGQDPVPGKLNIL